MWLRFTRHLERDEAVAVIKAVLKDLTKVRGLNSRIGSPDSGNITAAEIDRSVLSEERLKALLEKHASTESSLSDSV